MSQSVAYKMCMKAGFDQQRVITVVQCFWPMRFGDCIADILSVSH